MSNKFQCPDPATEKAGCLNYVWNRERANPVDGSILSKAGFGYNATAIVDYYREPEEPEEVNLAMSEKFGDWYYENWQWWDDILQPVPEAGRMGAGRGHLR